MNFRHAGALLWAMTACSGARPSSSEAPAAAETKPAPLRFMLDSFELDTAANGLSWTAAAEGHQLGTVAGFELASGGAVSTGNAARFYGRLASAQAAEPRTWARLSLDFRADSQPVDLRAVTAVRFWARGDGKPYEIIVHQGEAAALAPYRQRFIAPRDWQLFELPLTAVRASFESVRAVSFAPVQNNASFELYIDDIELDVDARRAFPWKIEPFVPAIPVLPLAELSRKKIVYQAVSLRSVANRSLVDERAGDGRGGWTDQGENSLLGFRAGKQSFEGVPFEIADEAEKQALVLRGNNAEELPLRAQISVGAHARAVYFLHASSGGPQGSGAYEVQYEDGASERIELRDRLEIFDFWSPDDSPYARAAWLGQNPHREVIGVTLLAWRNPHPNKRIRAIVATTPGTGAYLGLLGITLASEGPYLTPAPRLRLDDQRWFPYSGIHVAERRGTALDASGLLDAPAGKHGALTRKGEQLVFANGREARFWGVSFTEGMNFPSKQQADFIAELCAQLGVNLTHHRLRGPSLGSQQLDKLDYLVAQLMRRGIYIGLDVDQESVAAQLMERLNPYASKTYAQETGVAMVSIRLVEAEMNSPRSLTKTLRAVGYEGLIDARVDDALLAVRPKYDAGLSFAKKPAVHSERNLITDAAERYVAGDAFVVGESSRVQPVFRNDAAVMMAAYAGLHDWSPIAYSLGGSAFSEINQQSCKLDDALELKCQGGLLALWPALSRSFHRRDIKPSPVAHFRPSATSAGSGARALVDLPPGLAYIAKTGIQVSADSSQSFNVDDLLRRYVKGSSATSVTGELMTDWGKGLFLQDTPRSQAIVGATEGKKQSVSNLSVIVQNRWATLLATSLDDKPIAKSTHILVSAIGNAVNRGMTLSSSGVALNRAGGAPVLLEPMVGSVELTGLTGDASSAAAVSVFYLSVSGSRAGLVPVKTGPGSISFELKAEYRTQHYEVVRAGMAGVAGVIR